MLRWIQKHYIVSFLLLLIFVLCALHLNGTRNEERILPKQGLIIEKDITVDINRNPTAELKILSAANYSESYTIDVLPILKQYNCYIVDYLIVNEELYLLGRSNDTIPDMKLYPLLIFKINDTSLLDLCKKEVLEDLVLKAFQKAQNKAQEIAAEKTKDILGFDPSNLAGML